MSNSVTDLNIENGLTVEDITTSNISTDSITSNTGLFNSVRTTNLYCKNVELDISQNLNLSGSVSSLNVATNVLSCNTINTNLITRTSDGSKFATLKDISDCYTLIVDGAPGVLDTLREIADSVNNDISFSYVVFEKINRTDNSYNNIVVPRLNNHDTSLNVIDNSYNNVIVPRFNTIDLSYNNIIIPRLNNHDTSLNVIDNSFNNVILPRFNTIDNSYNNIILPRFNTIDNSYNNVILPRFNTIDNSYNNITIPRLNNHDTSLNSLTATVNTKLSNEINTDIFLTGNLYIKPTNKFIQFLNSSNNTMSTIITK